MNQDTVVSLATQAMTLAIEVAGPAAARRAGHRARGLASSRRSPRSRSRASPSSPRSSGVAALIVILGPWMLGQLVTYAQNLYTSIPQLVGVMSQLTLHDAVCDQIGGDHVTGFFLVLARVTPLFVLAPLFSSKMVPARVRAIDRRRRSSIGLTAGRRPRPARSPPTRCRWPGCSWSSCWSASPSPSPSARCSPPSRPPARSDRHRSPASPSGR